MLNATLGTAYRLNLKLSPLLGSPLKVLHSILESYISLDDDFGTAYAHIRPYWLGLPNITYQPRIHEACDREIRQKASINSRITKGNIPPRRVWDLYANRVVPFWVVGHRYPWAISHAWMEERERTDVWTHINAYEWPVPIPKDANLDLIRIELLNLGAEYVWLDVLCLRQAGGWGEDLRAEEWKVDVPTIGWVYQRAECVVYYLNGLGRPFRFEPGSFESDRSWFKRAWTLQEITDHPIIGGETGDDGIMEEVVRRRFHEQLESLWHDDPVFGILRQMQNRVSTNPLDKVAGLAYLFHSLFIPIYDASQSEEDAWEALVDTMPYHTQDVFFFFFQEPGNGNKRWRPSWQQVMTHALPSRMCIAAPVGWFESTEHLNSVALIDSGDVRGLAVGSANGKPRQGELIIKDNAGVPHTFTVVADHAYSIPDGRYTLIGVSGYRASEYSWVAGQRREDGRFEKLSYFGIADDREREKLEEIGVSKNGADMFLC